MSGISEQLRAWAPLVSSGYEVPAAGQSMLEAADRIETLEAALRPFAECAQWLKPEEDDEEWAKFRLLIKNYRDAARALDTPRE